jgi:hypothetical protein
MEASIGEHDERVDLAKILQSMVDSADLKEVEEYHYSISKAVG